jgi:N utilization substance protein B
LTLRREGREIALKALFQNDMVETPIDDALLMLFEDLIPRKEVRGFAELISRGTIAHHEEIDDIINRFAENWSLDRMANVDRSIIRIATYEMIFLDDIPASVSINEAVELAKKYSTAESGRFVNGILGNILLKLDELREQIRKTAKGRR